MGITFGKVSGNFIGLGKRFKYKKYSTRNILPNPDFRLPAVVDFTDPLVVGSFSKEPMSVVAAASGLPAVDLHPKKSSDVAIGLVERYWC